MEEAENSGNGPIPKNDDLLNSPAKSCALCGCSTPAVRCDRCNGQIFCLSCDDMYHKHPKRRLHLRKAVDSIWNSARSPRLRRRTDLPGDPSKIPIPPPRSKKRERHTIGGRMFLKPNHELGSFGHSKVFDLRSLTPTSKDVFAGPKTPTSIEGTYENETAFPAHGVDEIIKPSEIYENENVSVNQGETVDNSNSIITNPWNVQRTNISSPIQVSIPSGSPDLMANGQSFGYPLKPQSRSIADLTGAPSNPMGPHPYHLPHYPYMHPPVHPPFSHSMAHLNCAQCLSSSWSNLMSPHPSPYFHPMPWGSAQGSLTRGQAPPVTNGNLRHSHGSIPNYPDPNFHYPYPGAPYYPNGAPPVDPNFMRDLHQQAEESRMSKSSSKRSLNMESMDTAATASEAEVGNAERGTATEGKPTTEDEVPAVIPPPPSKPWSCMHCTFVNPPGSHICQVCCKTSYKTYASAPSDDQNERALHSRNSDSPMELVNLDAISQSPDFSEHREAQKCEESIGEDSLEYEEMSNEISPGDVKEAPEAAVMLCTETQTFTTTKSTDVQTQNLMCKSMASSTDSIFPKQEISVQTEIETAAKSCSVATDPMISSQSMESLLSGISAPPYHNRRAGWGRGTSYSTQSLFERGRSRSPIPRSLSMYNEAHSFGRDSSLPPEEAMHSWSQAWLMSDPMYYKPHNIPGLEQQPLTKEDYFDGTWGSMDKLDRRMKNKMGEKLKSQQRPKLHRSLDDLKAEKAQDFIHSRELQFLQTVKEAERCGFSLEDLHVAFLHCGREDPVIWLEDNWSSMIKNVIALAAKYGEDNEENDVGVITSTEAKEALHIHRGDIWDAVTECIENRQRKILELTVRGNFTQKQISDALKNNEGNIELAYADLLRASTKRHKFILSPGLSEDSDMYNPIDDSSASLKTAKHDISIDSKPDKKKSDFLTKLTSIRQAQSERRKAREEKEMTRETVTQEMPTTVDEASNASPLMEHEKELDLVQQKVDVMTPELNVEAVQENIEKDICEAELELEEPLQDSLEKKEVTEDNLPVDYDTNWVESQGEWIEEYSDEHWDEESDENWVTLQKKYQKMEKEFEEEAIQMAALWEKEELSDDVFEDEPKEVQQSTQESEAERLKAEQDEKFQQWVKLNLEKSTSEPEDNEVTELAVNTDLLAQSSLSKSAEFDRNIICESPLTHYPPVFDLSKKPELDWVELDVTGENPALHGISTRDIEEVLDHELNEQEILKDNDVRTEVSALNAGNSDEEWEKIDENELLELKQAEELMAPSEIGISEQLPASEILAKHTPEQKKILESQLFEEEISEKTIPTMESENKFDVSKEKSPEVGTPKPPVRRKSKLNGAAIEEALRYRQQMELDVPPALPQKIKDKSPDKNAVVDLYAVPQKFHHDEKTDAPAPLKPPRLNLSPSAESARQLGEIEDKKRLNVEFSKEASPVTSLSNESDSNCFADSESDPEIKIIRQKYMHHKTPKYENEDEELFEESFTKAEDKSLRHAVEEANASFEFNPELPIPIGTRGSRVVDEMASPKAFREGSARPLQLFKIAKPDHSPVVTTKLEEDISTVKNLNDGQAPKYLPERTEQPAISDSLMSEFMSAESQIETSQITDSQYYNTEVIEQISKDAIPTDMQSSDLHYYNIGKVENFTPNVSSDPLQADSSYYYNAEEILPTPDAINIPQAMNVQQEETRVQSQLTNIIPAKFEETIPVTSFQEQPEFTEEKEEENILLEFDTMPAAAEYFFGRYNEVVVAKPKKKSPVIKSNKPAGVPKVMSTSEIKVSSPAKSPTPMEVSASPVMMSADALLDKPQKIESKLDSLKSASPIPPTVSTPPIPPEPAATEYVSFADDYFFGSYNEIVPKKAVKKKPVSFAPKPKMADKPKFSNVTTSPSELSNKMSSSSLETGVTGANQANLSMTTSLPEAFHQSPDNLEFDGNVQMMQMSMLTENSELAMNKLPMEANEGDTMLDSQTKNVHFEEVQPVAAPPRKKKSKPEPNIPSIPSYAEEHRYMEQYEERRKGGPFSILDKKKLPPYSEDFRMNQGCDPSNLPSNSLLPSAEQQESFVSSEIRLHTAEEPFIMEKEVLKMKEIENVGSQSFEIPSLNKVKDFSDSPSVYQLPMASSEETVAPEYSCQSGGGLFKPPTQLQELQNSDEIHSLDPETSCATSDKTSHEFSKAPEITSAISENIPAALSSSEDDWKFQGRAPSDLELQVPKLAQSQIQKSELSKDISVISRGDELFISSEDDKSTERKNEEHEQKIIDSSIDQLAEYSEMPKEDSLIPDANLSVLTFDQLATGMNSSDLASSSHEKMEDSEENRVMPESLSGKFESDGILQKDLECEDESYGVQYRDSKLEDDYSILQMDEDFEDGLQLVEETEKLISEFCDIYPSDCFDVSSNEIQNMNTKNNKHDYTYDSEYEWKLNEERYNSLNANFIENKVYKMDITTTPNPEESNAPLIINTGTPADNLELNKSITETRKSTSSLADISEISEFIDESNFAQIIEKSHVADEDVSASVLPLSVLCQAATYNNIEGFSSELMPSCSLLPSEKENLETVNEASDDSLVNSTHSSVSTQIAVFADTLIQDLTEDLGISLDNRATEDLGEKSSTSSNIPLNLAEEVPMLDAGQKEETEIEEYNEKVKSSALIEKGTKDLHDFDSSESRILNSEYYKSEIVEELDNLYKVQQTADASINEPSDLYTVSDSVKSMEAPETDIIKKLNTEIKTETEVEKATSNEQITDELSEDVISGNSGDLYASKVNAIGISDPECTENLQDKISDDVSEDPSLSLMSHFYDEWIGKTVDQIEGQQSEELKGETKIELPDELNMETTIKETEELMKDIETEWTEVESNYETRDGLSIEKNTDPEESLMSHFYDEWIETVRTSDTHPAFQIDIRNLYVSNDLSESASSGNVSENEDFSSINKAGLPVRPSDSNLSDTYIESVADVSENKPIELFDQGEIYVSDEKDQPQVQEAIISETCVENQNFFKSYDGDILNLAVQQVKVEEDVLSNISDKAEDSVPDVQDISEHAQVEIIDSFMEKMYSISKSCQTDDSFEEDQFFDSFDDPAFDPAFLFPSVLKSTHTEPAKTEIGVQCSLIPSEVVLISDVATISLDPNESRKEIKKKEKEEKVEYIKGTIRVDDESALQILDAKKDVIVVSDSSIKLKEDSSSEDTDSDIFLEPDSSHDEFETDPKSKGSYLYAEVDSDTGFSSGSDSGRRSSKQKYYTKGAANLISYNIKSECLHEESRVSDEVAVQETKVSKIETMEQKVSHVTIKSESAVLNEEEMKCSDNEKKEIILLEETKLTTEECIVPSDGSEIDLPQEILKRAVTPISIKRIPSIESDLKFVDIKDENESSELDEQVIDTKTCDDRAKTPTVEYFYGPLPKSVQKEIHLESSESFVEALDLLDACAAEVEKDISENSFSTQMSDSKFSSPADSGDVEDFSESLGSFHEPDDDLLTESVSEYFGLPDNEGTLDLEAKVRRKDIKMETICDDSLKIHKKVDLKKASTFEQQNLVPDVSKSSFPKDIYENLEEIEIQKKTPEKNLKEFITEVKAEQTSESVLIEKNDESTISADIPQLGNTESVIGIDNASSALGFEKGTYSETVSDSLSTGHTTNKPDAQKADILQVSEQKERPADISAPCVDIQKESKEMCNVTEHGDSLYVDSITDYFSVEKTSKKVSESSSDTEGIYQKSLTGYFSTEIESADIKQAESVEYLKDSSSVETNSDVVTIDRDIKVLETYDHSVDQETEISVYEESSDYFKSLNEIETFKQAEIPSAPSDIVRYLYYDDSITFDDDSSICEDSFNSIHFAEQSSSKLVTDISYDSVSSLDKKRQEKEFKESDTSPSLLLITTQEPEKISSDISINLPSSNLDDSTNKLKSPDADLEKLASDVQPKAIKEVQQESKTLDKSLYVEISSQLEQAKVSTDISLKSFKSDQEESPEKSKTSKSDDDFERFTFDHEPSSSIEQSKFSSDNYVDKSSDLKEFSKEWQFLHDQSKVEHDNIEKLDKNRGNIDVIDPNEKSPETPLQISKSEAISHPIQEISTSPQEAKVSLSSTGDSQNENPETKLPEISEFSEIPSKPSDIVRYLYYDDSIQFEGDESLCDESFNSIHFSEPSPIPELNIASSNVISTNLNVNEPLQEPLISDVNEQLPKEDLLPPSKSAEPLESSITPTSLENITDEQFIHACDSEKDQYESVYSVSESTDQWFDLETSKSFQHCLEESQISEGIGHLTQTKTTTQDGDLPCIPGLILEGEDKDNAPIAVADSDEVTDISTHFTMTEDESDKFSDIESDSSANNFDDEVFFTVDQNKNDIEDFEIDKIAEIEDFENMIHQDDLLDQNANINEENYPEECATPTEFEKQEQDIEASLKDVNGNLAMFVSNSGVSDTIENIGSETQNVDTLSKDQNISIQTTESEIYAAPDSAVMKSTPTESCNDEFFDISQTEESLNIFKTEPDNLSKDQNLLRQTTVSEIDKTSDTDVIRYTPTESCNDEFFDISQTEESLSISKTEPDNLPKDQNCSAQTAKSEVGWIPDIIGLRSTPIESCKDEFFDISQAENSLDISATGNSESWIDAESGVLTETKELKCNLSDDGIPDTTFVFEITDSLVKKEIFNISFKEDIIISDDQIEKVKDVAASKQQVVSLITETGSVSKELLFETKDNMPADSAISSVSHEISLEKGESSQIVEEIPSSDLAAFKTSYISETSPNIAYTNDVLESLTLLTKEDISNFSAIPEQRDASRDTCGVLYETKERDSDDFPKRLEALPNPVSDVSRTECIPNFGTEGKISLSFDENASLEDKGDICAQLKTASGSDEGKLKPDEIKASDAQESYIVDFRGIIGEQDNTILNYQLKDETEREAVSISISDDPNTLKSDIKKIETVFCRTENLPAFIDSSVKLTENVSDENLDSGTKEITISKTIVHDETAFDFKGIVDDSVFLNSQQKHSPEKETVENFKSYDHFESSSLKSEIVVEQVVEKQKHFSNNTVHDEVTVDFKGIIEDSLKKETFSISQSIEESNICQPAFKATANFELESASPFEQSVENLVKSKDKIIIAEDVEQGKCTVDFKGIAADLDLFNNEQNIAFQEQTLFPVVSDSIKQKIEASSEKHLIHTFGKESDKKYFEKKDKISSALGAEDNIIVDFKGVILHSELISNQQYSGEDGANFNSSVSVEHIESNILKSETKEIGNLHSEVSVLSATIKTVGDIKNGSQIQLIKEKDAASLESVESEKYIVDFKTVISDSNLVGDLDGQIESSDQNKLFQPEGKSFTTMGSLVSTVENSSQEKIKELALSEVDEKAASIADFKGIVSNSEAFSEKMQLISEMQTCGKVLEENLYKAKTLPAGIGQETNSVDFRGIAFETELLIDKQKATKEKEISSIFKSVEQLKQKTSKEDVEEITVQKQLNGFSAPADTPLDNKNFQEKIINEVPRESVNEMSMCSDPDSSYFHSALEDIDSASVFTSDDDFTDVHSHIILTEDSDRFSDIETDTSFAFEDLNQDSFDMLREKTPTRDDYEHSFGVNYDAAPEPEVPGVSYNVDIPPKEMDSTKNTEERIKIEIEKQEFAPEAVPVETASALYKASLEPSSSPTNVLCEETKLALLLSEEEKLTSQTSFKGGILPVDCSHQTSLVPESDIGKTSDSSRENYKTISSTDQIDLSFSTVSKEDDSEKFLELEPEISETSASSFFETISKDDDSEKISDFETSEGNLKLAEKIDESTVLFSDTSKKDSKKSPSTETEDKELADTSCNIIPVASVTKEVYSTENVAASEHFKESVIKADNEHLDKSTFDILPEPVPLVVGKKALSLSIADIVESSELNIACDQTTEPLILEQFADVKSLSHQVAMIENFNTFEIDTAVPKVHKEADTSLGIEKTEDSDNWLEAETEYSISEFEDEAVSFSDKEKPEPQPSETVDGSGIAEDKRNAFQTATQSSAEDTTGISSSFYSESEYSDQVSDTFADTSLQGGTTENSDRWSDIEAEEVINELAENVPIIDAKELITGLNGKQESTVQSEADFVEKESKLVAESDTVISKEIVITSEFVEEVKEKLLCSSFIETEAKYDNKIAKQLSSTPEKLLDTASGISDDDFTSVTPIDPTVGESDKWSDISDDTSIEEMLDSSKSLSLQKDISNQPDSKPKAVPNDDKEIDADDTKHEQPKSYFDLPIETEAIEESNIYIKSPIISEDQALVDDVNDNCMPLSETGIAATLPSDIDDTSRYQSESTIETGVEIQDDAFNSNDHPSPLYEDEEPLDGEEYYDEYDPNFDEHEMELVEEDYHSGSVPYILNDDELVYPLQYGDKWIEESFDLKEYGIETGFTGSEVDVHGLNINEEFEDIHRAIDFNINNFEEATENFMDDQNLTTESFKTLSDNTPTHSKLTDKEHDSWSTADADSISDDLSDHHDDVLAKIDEILAEDFGYGKLEYFDDKKGNHGVESIIEEIEEDIYSQGSPIDSPYKEEIENLQLDSTVCKEKSLFSSVEIPSSSEVVHGLSADAPFMSEDSRHLEKCSDDSSSLLKDVYPSADEIKQSATVGIKATAKIKQASGKTFETKEELKETFSSDISEKLKESEGLFEKLDISTKETFSLKLAPEKIEISTEVKSEKASVSPKESLKSKSPEKTDTSLEESVKLKMALEEVSKSSSEVIKLKLEKTFSKEEASEVASNKIVASSEKIIQQSSLGNKASSSKDTVKLLSADKDDLPKEKVLEMKESSEEIGISSKKILGESNEVLLNTGLDKTITTSEELILNSSAEKTILQSEETAELQSHRENDFSTGKTVKLKESSEHIGLSPEKVVEKSLEKSVSLEKVSANSSEKLVSSQKLAEIATEGKSASQEKEKEKSSKKESECPEKIAKKSADKKSASPEKIVEKSFEKKSLSSEKEVEKSLEKIAVPDEERQLKTSLISTQKITISTEDTVNSKSSSEKNGISSKEEHIMKLEAKKDDRPSEGAFKLKSSLEKTSISEGEKTKLNKCDFSGKTTELETSEKTGHSQEEDEALSLLSDKAALPSEATAKLKLSAEAGNLSTEKGIKLKDAEETEVSSEKTVKKSTKKKSVPPKETVELKSSPEKVSASLEESKKADIAVEKIPASPDKATKRKASTKTDVLLEESEKAKLSLQKTAISSEETVKLRASPEKTDVSSKHTVSLKSSTDTSELSDEATKMKAYTKTDVLLEESEKAKLSLQKTAIFSEETVKLRASPEKTDVSSKHTLSLKSSTDTSELSSDNTVKLKTSEKFFTSSEEKTVKLQSKKTTLPSEETTDSKTSLEKSSKLTVETKASSKKSETDVKQTSYKEASVTQTEVRPDIPLKKKHATDMVAQTEDSVKIPVQVSYIESDSSQSISDIPTESDSKPNIPDKTRRRSRPKTDTVSEDEAPRRRRSKPEAVLEDETPRRRRPKPKTTSEEEGSQRSELKPESMSEDEGSSKAPALPCKRLKRDSSIDSLSSSILSSSSESLSSFETASLKDTSKSDSSPFKTSSSVSEDVPEIPARKAKVKCSPIRQRQRENSEDSSSASAASKASVKSCDLPPKEAMDLCRKRTSIDERMIKLQNEGKCNTKEKAFIAAKLIEMQFEEEDALLAARQCNSVYHAIKFLTQLCELCNCRFPINLMSSMVYCTHRACKECFKAHFTSLIYDRSVFTFLCPICNKPDITDQNIQEYFNHLDIMFRSMLDSHVYDLFQRKLRDEVLTKDPNFHWCSQCSSGFIASPRLKKLYCPDCSAITCASCHQTWELEHEGVHCERFQQWKDMHTPEPPPAGLVKYLVDRGVTCPSCELEYPQACGGCLMYKCSHCSFEFCGFCSMPFKRGKDCGNKSCESRGMHCHHPYRCLFFLRDIEMSDLQMLLEEESVTYLTIPPKDQIVKSRCQVREQKHIHGSLSEDRCGRDIVPYCAGLCRTHYYEYLAELFRKNKINPLPIMTTKDLQFILRKSRVLVPDRVKGETNDDYYKRLTEVVSSTLT